MLSADQLNTRVCCRACGGLLDPLLDLGTPVLSGFVKPGEPDPAAAPLSVVVCQTCQLVQLEHSVHPDLLYGGQYWYQSGINETMVAELRSVVAHACRYVDYGQTSTVLDIGANDGTLLRAYDQQAIIPRRIAVEPSATFHLSLAEACDSLLHAYFPSDAVRTLPAKSIVILTTIACFYDLEDPRAAVQEVDRLLRRDGVWIVQMQDLLQMVRATAWDNVCHEHLAYYSLDSFSRLLEGTDLQVIDAEPRVINGGSLRITVGRTYRPVSLQVEAWRAAESAQLTRRRLEIFAWEAEEHRDRLRETVDFYAKDYPIDLYACSTKANTLLQWAGIDHRQIRQGVERSAFKVGLETAGTRILIVSEETWRADPAPITLQGAWQFRDAILQREAAYIAGGGSFLVPLPWVEVIHGAR